MPWPYLSSEHPLCETQIPQTVNHFGFGALHLNSHRRISEFRDGTSTTILVGERTGQRTKNSYEFDLRCRAFWGFGMHTGHLLSAGYYRPNQQIADRDIQGDDIVKHGFSSAHTGGLNVVLADGSVRFISDNIDSATEKDLAAIKDLRDVTQRQAVYKVWQSLCEINDGGIVGDF